MVADAESAITRESSRGLPGGSFLLATILNRKDVRTKKGKEAVDSFKDFFILKSDAMFCTLFLSKYNLDENIDNTPVLLKKATKEQKLIYLHSMVADALKDLIPYFKEVQTDVGLMMDYPLGEGRTAFVGRKRFMAPQKLSLNATHILSDVETLNAVSALTSSHKEEYLKRFMTIEHSSRHRTNKPFDCSMCSSAFKYETICLTHIEHCIATLSISEPSIPDDSQNDDLSEQVTITSETCVAMKEADQVGNKVFCFKNN